MKAYHYLLLITTALMLQGCCAFIRCVCTPTSLEIRFSQDAENGFTQTELDSMWVYQHGHVGYIDSTRLENNVFVFYRDGNDYTIKNSLIPSLKYQLSNFDTVFEEEKGCCGHCRTPRFFVFNLNGKNKLSYDHNDDWQFNYTLNR